MSDEKIKNKKNLNLVLETQNEPQQLSNAIISKRFSCWALRSKSDPCPSEKAP